MGQTMEKAIINARHYDRVIIRRKTWDGCVCEQEYGPDGDRHITPTIEIAYRVGVSRKYLYIGTRIENRPKPYGGDDMTCLVAEYTEDIESQVKHPLHQITDEEWGPALGGGEGKGWKY